MRSTRSLDGSAREEALATLSHAVAPAVMSRKAQLRHLAMRDYARLRLHARHCTDCTPGTTDTDPPVINRVCRAGMAGMFDYRRSYQAWVDCPEGEGS